VPYGLETCTQKSEPFSDTLFHEVKRLSDRETKVTHWDSNITRGREADGEPPRDWGKPGRCLGWCNDNGCR